MTTRLLKDSNSKMGHLNWPLMENNITKQDMTAVIEFLRQNPILTQSTNVRAFEEEWSRWLGVKYSVFVNSGSSANLLTMAALREHFGGGEIILPPLTWVSDVASVLQNGFKPVFADIHPKTVGMDEDQVIRKIGWRTKAVFLTHILGYNALTEKMLTVLHQKNIPLIEDVCESYGATFKGRRLGSFGFASNFSFYYAHHLSTIEGGMICTNNKNFYETVRMMRAHGLVRESTSQKLKMEYQKKYSDLNPEFIFAFPAYNVRSTEINAVIGRHQLKRLNQEVKLRNRNLRLFLKGLNPEKYRVNFMTKGCSNYALTLILKEADPKLCARVMKALRDHGVEFRRGTSGGGNQLRQPYLRRIMGQHAHRKYPQVEHVHFYGFYIGNYPDLRLSKIRKLCRLLNSL